MKNRHYFVAIIAIMLVSSGFAQMPTVELVHVQGGEFTMGCTDKHSDCSVIEAPAHPVKLNGFYMAVCDGEQESVQDYRRQLACHARQLV